MSTESSGAVVQTLKLQSQVNEHGILKIEVPCNLPPGPVEVVVTVQPAATPTSPGPDWKALYGLGREIWQGIDTDQYLRELREDREIAW